MRQTNSNAFATSQTSIQAIIPITSPGSPSFEIGSVWGASVCVRCSVMRKQSAIEPLLKAVRLVDPPGRADLIRRHRPDSPSTTLGSPLVSPGFAGLVPVDLRQSMGRPPTAVSACFDLSGLYLIGHRAGVRPHFGPGFPPTKPILRVLEIVRKRIPAHVANVGSRWPPNGD
jgi:hypothetical protein